MDSLLFFLGLMIFLEVTFLLIMYLLGKKPRVGGRRKVFVDTSALMDGRIVDVAKTGFLTDNFLIPRSVTREMQLLADGKDTEKRSRARIGLENVNEMERIAYCDAEIFDDARFGRMPVDERLLRLAKEEGGLLLTCDYNLAKVAMTEGIEILNINELAIALANVLQKGDKFKLIIRERGSGPKQGVGHLADGTMVVVDNAEKLVGKEVNVEFVRLLQTNAGKIVFGKIPSRKTDKKR